VASLQEGVYYAPKERPGKFFGIFFMRAARDCDAARAGQRVAELWKLYKGLKQGRIPDLAPTAVPHEHDHMTVLIALGPNAFKLSGAKQPLPGGLGDDRLFASPRPTGGGPLLVGSGLQYASDVRANFATEEVCFQVIADTKLAVDRTIVETWKLLSDAADPHTGLPDLEPTTFYLGFQRPDHRSWIDFHDGLSNLHSEEREDAIAIKAGTEDEWCVGGTYLAFMRLAVDLPAWRRLSRSDQELLVGRDKLSGCPITEVGADGELRTDPACPVAGTQIWETPNDPKFSEPRGTGDATVAASHVQRANHHLPPASDPGSRRIFRQGYEFMEWKEGAPGFRAGLNFVSFQDTTERLIKMLTNEGWLGRVNFGGDAAHPLPGMEQLLSVYAGGVFLAPPQREGEAFPGASVFGV
jgi:Dyp-type peroxidase family